MPSSNSNRKQQASSIDPQEERLGDSLERVQVEQVQELTTPPASPVPANPFKRALLGLNGPYAQGFNPLPGTPMPTGAAGLSADLLASATASTKKPKTIVRKEVNCKLTICDMGGEEKIQVLIAAQNFFIPRQVLFYNYDFKYL